MAFSALFSFCVLGLFATVIAGAYLYDPRFTVLLLPPLAAGLLSEIKLPAVLDARLRNPGLLEKMLLSFGGVWLGCKLTGVEPLTAFQGYSGGVGDGGQEF
mmetsp:Transcript_40072/g.78283  ORF Transcript_40072/g.78283 Transcript_40072/m.78283 type:complete len:101 (-) Transcript_40072:314-616(-)